VPTLSLALGFGICHVQVSQAQEVLNNKVSVQAQNQSLENVLSQIEKQTGVRFVYAGSLISEKDKVTFSAQNQNLKQVLNGIFSNRNIDFSFSGNNQIVLKASPKSQDHTSVSGKITDAQTGDALPGVNVSVKGTSKGATSDANGNLKLVFQIKTLYYYFPLWDFLLKRFQSKEETISMFNYQKITNILMR
jgi:type II secretory pathway component GspD/PulD (secretin)